MGKDKKKGKGSVFGYLLMLIGLAVAGFGGALAFEIQAAADAAVQVPVLKDFLGDKNVLYGIAGGGAALFVIGLVLKPKKDKKKK